MKFNKSHEGKWVATYMIINSWHSEDGNNGKAAIQTAYDLLTTKS